MSSPIVPNVLTNVAATRALDGLQELTRNVAAPSERSRQCKKVNTFCIYGWQDWLRDGAGRSACAKGPQM